MSGGLRHHNDEENGPSHAVGYKSSKKQDSYSLERNQCVCAVEEVCPDLQKPEPKSLDRTGVVRDVEKLISAKNRESEIASGCDMLPSLFNAINYPHSRFISNGSYPHTRP